MNDSSSAKATEDGTSTGVDARLAAVLCYAGWWVTGLVFLFAERRNGRVRFHAAQSLIVFGALSVVLFLCGGASAVAFFIAMPTFQVLQSLGNAVWLATVLLWVFLLLKAWQGETWRVPIAGDLALKVAGRM